MSPILENVLALLEEWEFLYLACSKYKKMHCYRKACCISFIWLRMEVRLLLYHAHFNKLLGACIFSQFAPYKYPNHNPDLIGCIM